jgi:hypothetical protein
VRKVVDYCFELFAAVDFVQHLLKAGFFDFNFELLMEKKRKMNLLVVAVYNNNSYIFLQAKLMLFWFEPILLLQLLWKNSLFHSG